MPTINVIEPGMYTTVQDAGRPGFLRYGLPPSGAMDARAYESANGLLGNDPHVAVLECSGTMPVLECDQRTRIAVAYADRCETLEAGAGEVVRFDPISTGFRAYIAFACGIDVPLVMGSRSTYVPGMLGGFKGRTLRAGDVLKVGQASGPSMVRRVPAGDRLEAYPALRVIPGPEADWFDCVGLNTFLTEAFFVSAKSNRTGIRLDGTPLSFRSDAQMVSAGLAFGTIQVPPSGLPIIMMADHPTTGGYPRIGNVVQDDLSILAQLRPGNAVRFVEVGLFR
jgi:antagonist of KipI